MRLSMAVQHPGDLLLTVTESFPEYYVSGQRKMDKVVVPYAFSLEYLSVAVFPLGS